MTRALLALLLIFPALPAFADAPVKIDPDALILKHSEEEVAKDPAVVAARKQVGDAFGADNSAKNSRTDLNRQIEAANEKYMQESRTVAARSPEEYRQFIESHMQRANNLNDQLRSTGGDQVQTREQLDAARKLMALAVFQARIDNPAFPVYIAEGASWIERKDGRLEQRVILRDIHDARYQLVAPQRIDQLGNASCSYFPVWGEIWAVRAPGITSEGNHAQIMKIASLKQVYLLNHAASPGCPFGQVLVPAPVQR